MLTVQSTVQIFYDCDKFQKLYLAGFSNVFYEASNVNYVGLHDFETKI